MPLILARRKYKEKSLFLMDEKINKYQIYLHGHSVRLS